MIYLKFHINEARTVGEIFDQFKLGKEIFVDIITVSKTYYHINSELEANCMLLKILTHKNDLILNAPQSFPRRAKIERKFGMRVSGPNLRHRRYL